MTSHQPKRSQAARGNPYMMNTQPAADSTQTGQASGTRNGRGRYGSL